MSDAAKVLVGEHDFGQMGRAMTPGGSTIRQVTAFDVVRVGELVRLEVEANAFLRHQVRRMASRIAQVLRGKYRPEFSPHVAFGDHVVVVNAEKVKVTGAKLEQKVYYRHSGYPGGLREDRLNVLLKKDPERVIRLAVRGMLPRNRLARQQLGNLKIYAGQEHPHAAQSPRAMIVAPAHAAAAEEE
jgi:large subunit ribosomal protein L13